MPALHEHATEGNVVLFGRMERKSSPGEEVVAVSLSLAVLVLVAVVGQEGLPTPSPVLHLAVTIAHVQVGIDQ